MGMGHELILQKVIFIL